MELAKKIFTQPTYQSMLNSCRKSQSSHRVFVGMLQNEVPYIVPWDTKDVVQTIEFLVAEGIVVDTGKKLGMSRLIFLIPFSTLVYSSKSLIQGIARWRRVLCPKEEERVGATSCNSGRNGFLQHKRLVEVEPRMQASAGKGGKRQRGWHAARERKRQAAGHSSALFLTAAAQNLLCIKLAEELGVMFSNPWVQWFEAASVPGIVALLANPIILYKLSPPEIKDTPDAPALAARKLQEMGPITIDEWIMIATMLFAVAFWIFGGQIGITSVVTAMLGLCILLLLGVLDWDDCLNEKAAWDTLAWFAVLVGMASQLTSLGIVQWLADGVDSVLLSLSLGWPAAFVILQESRVHLQPLPWPITQAFLVALLITAVDKLQFTMELDMWSCQRFSRLDSFAEC
ncbi:hypothetical protein L7F22_054964 [Adiantum nelumboides]|nr:hypothetical protein [Adiantum nelumboides]